MSKFAEFFEKDVVGFAIVATLALGMVGLIAWAGYNATSEWNDLKKAVATLEADHRMD